jgi:branched-chain amino acid aminotransferase
MKGDDQTLLSLDGPLPPHTEALGWQWAYGCFETFLWNSGKTVALEKHLARFFLGCRSLEMDCPLPEGEGRVEIEKALAPFAGKSMRVRLEGVLDDSRLMNGGSPPFRMRVGLRSNEMRAPNPNEDFCICLLDPESSISLPPMPRYKPLDYWTRLRLRNRTMRQGFDEGIVVTEDLRIVSGLISNLFVRTQEGTWLTPNIESGCLPGVTRALLLEGVWPEPIVEREVHLHDLTEATAAVMTNSTIGAQPVNRLHIEEGVVKEYDLESSLAMADWHDRVVSKD